MASKSRSALADINAKTYNFNQLIELIYKTHNKQNDLNKDGFPEDELVRFKANGTLAFPTSDISNLKETDDGKYLLETTFLGLQGSQSPLPTFYLEKFAWSYTQDESGLNHFLDLFNHRFITLFHRIWRKYRYYISYNNGLDSFSQRMFAFVGLENPNLRKTLQINHSKMLSYVGLLSGTARSPEVISGLIAHCFDLDDVSIMPWQERIVPIQPDQQTFLGKINSELGENFVIGDNIDDCNGKFLLCLNQLTVKRYLSFLPSGELFEPLKTLVTFILRDQLAFDVRLSLAKDQLDEMNLGNEISCLLGWTTFIGEMPDYPSITICMRE
ncbi:MULTISPECIES: type VI secretion system baseplate subunit TssG [Gilliamella]|jgi:type VI secretion system protein ImpH|uniref:Type VI secretion system protein ImpH n=1 Tax=Gilliamella intestini TaxID=1798183 RepID=A0A1C4B208_9GAMM|nr:MULTISPECIES: type VI secretion system baseplate subunit TssG [Gilliamella]OCG49105.1 hypothetical protein A9G35_12615 [Gilliamella apicola]SCC00849.1 type VI secretion system protein ImpH [Gilliamella intestini]